MSNVAPAILVLVALACVLLALALWLFARAKRRWKLWRRIRASRRSKDS